MFCDAKKGNTVCVCVCVVTETEVDEEEELREREESGAGDERRNGERACVCRGMRMVRCVMHCLLVSGSVRLNEREKHGVSEGVP